MRIDNIFSDSAFTFATGCFIGVCTRAVAKTAPIFSAIVLAITMVFSFVITSALTAQKSRFLV